MKKVLAFGTFDILHPGHEYLLAEAKNNGERLVVVVARDATVKSLKGVDPLFSEDVRAANLDRLDTVDVARLGNVGDKMKVIHEEAPDVICLGYDQKIFVDELEATFSDTKIIRVSAFMPRKHKSSRYRSQYVKGTVVKGIGEGKRLGYPTANLHIKGIQQEVEPGIFAATTWVDKNTYPSIAIVGAREEEGLPLFEIYLLDHEEDLYGQELIAKLEYKVREMEHFTAEEALIKQIEKDIQHVHRNRPKYWESIKS